jgi:predicted DsbA family dithiol-disulfide isomerase
MKLIIYGDFNCPYSCLASARADGLLGRGLAEVEWRAVEHDPSIPAPSEVADGDVAAMLGREVAEVRGLLRTAEVFPIAAPPVHPNTAAAVAAFADAGPPNSDGLRRRLFAALWFDGRDIGDPTVVEALGGELERGPVPVVGNWREAWLGLERPMVPMLVLPDGYVSRGLGALARLADLSGVAR